MNGSFVRLNRELRTDRGSRIHSELMLPVGALTLLLLLAGCSDRGNAVSGTIEVDEAHVGPRSGGRVEKILAWEGDRLHEGQVIVQLDASELRARRDLASAQIDTAVHDADAQEAQLVFLHDDARRSRICSTEESFRPLTRSAPTVRRKRRRRILQRRRCASHRRVHNWQIWMRSWPKCRSSRRRIPFSKCSA